MADVDAAAVVSPEPPLASVGTSTVVETATVEEPSDLLEKTDEPPVLPHKEVVTVEAPAPTASDDNKPVLAPLPPPQQHHEKLAHSSGSFKEESNKTSDLSDAQRACLSDLRGQIQNVAALASASIWGIPLFKDDRTDVVLLKFLRARDFKVNEALAMFRSTVEWRTQFGIDRLLEEELGDDLEKAVFMHGFDKEGHPVCFNVYGEFQNKEVYEKTFGNEEKRVRFLRWRIQFLEKSIRKLDFSPGGICTIFQVDLPRVMLIRA